MHQRMVHPSHACSIFLAYRDLQPLKPNVRMTTRPPTLSHAGASLWLDAAQNPRRHIDIPVQAGARPYLPLRSKGASAIATVERRRGHAVECQLRRCLPLGHASLREPACRVRLTHRTLSLSSRSGRLSRRTLICILNGFPPSYVSLFLSTLNCTKKDKHSYW